MKSQEPNVTERLQHTLAQWQALYLLYETNVHAENLVQPVPSHLIGPAQNGTRLPEAILNNSITTLNPSEWYPDEEMLTYFEAENPLIASLRRYMSFPSELFTWNRRSRRVFHLPHGLQALLAAASFPDIPWTDVLLPHESFIITMEKPLRLVGDEGEVDEYDTILVTKLPHELDGGHVSVRLLDRPNQEGIKVGFGFEEIREYREQLKRGNFEGAVDIAARKGDRLAKLYGRMPGSTSCALEVALAGESLMRLEPEQLFELEFLGSHAPGTFISPDTPQWETLPRIEVARYEVMSVACRIAFGWMLYLESLMAKPGTLEWKAPPKKKAQSKVGGTVGAITEPEKVCNIIGRGKIDPTEYGTTGTTRTGPGFVRPHWRRAHKKRPPGSAPGAPKTIKIPNLLIRADLVPLYGIIGGTKSVMISED